MNHLTSEQLSQWIAGSRTQEQEQHVCECAQCAAAVAKTEGLLLEFRGAYRQWGDAQFSSPVARPVVRHHSMWLRAALAAALVIGIAIPAGQKLYQNRVDQQQVSIDDDALLTQIQADVSRSVPASLKPLADVSGSEK
jgi:hypothetical protein